MNFSSIRVKILIPVCILGIISIISNLIAFSSIQRVNSAAKEIADVHMKATIAMNEIEFQTEEIHVMALSHIISTDFNSMIGMSDSIDEMNGIIENTLEELKEYIDENDDDYLSVVENYNNLNLAIRKLTAFSANQKTVQAYGIANGEVKEYSEALSSGINNLVDEIKQRSEDANNTLDTVYGLAVSAAIVFIILSIASVILAFFIVIRKVINPIIKSQKEITEIIDDIDRGEGDLTKRITINGQDEISSLGNGINNFMSTLQNILSSITDNSERMDKVVTEVLGSVHTSNDSASDLSALTEELAATMQEVANNANVINTNAEHVSEEVNVIAEKSSEINDYSKNMKMHADSMEQAARSNMEQTSLKVNEILEVLGQAIEDAKSVDQVNSLTDDILSISSQTNLLALNASIEAARAGEAGKGFAVVADEISALADSSRQAANNIQQINQIVTAAVHNLSDHANGLVDYMQESILPEFQQFVEEGDQYKSNATYIENSMNEFTAKTDDLKAIVSEIAESIATISSAIDDGVDGVTGTAERTQNLVMDMDNITQRMDENQKIAGDLMAETSIFTKLQ